MADISQTDAAKTTELENHIKNPYGGEGFNHWVSGTEDHCNGFGVQGDGTFEGRSHAFVSSYNWCTLSQKVPIDPSRSHRVTVFTYASRRTDGGAYAQLRVNVENSRRVGVSRLLTYEIECPYEPVNDTFCAYKKLGLEFSVEEGTTSIEVIIRGKDMVGWNGHYGARFGFTALYLS
mmetsp:Transcript_21037/g.38939  ORF Transcript_21037/g.38939 Transcript_21037/m.38939 type:complete len:177 (+) Transcript_21037:47-577(+)